jgi:hypothetical protein
VPSSTSIGNPPVNAGLKQTFFGVDDNDLSCALTITSFEQMAFEFQQFKGIRGKGAFL